MQLQKYTRRSKYCSRQVLAWAALWRHIIGYSSNLSPSTYMFVAPPFINRYFASCATLCCTRNHNIQPSFKFAHCTTIRIVSDCTTEIFADCTTRHKGRGGFTCVWTFSTQQYRILCMIRRAYFLLVPTYVLVVMICLVFGVILLQMTYVSMVDWQNDMPLVCACILYRTWRPWPGPKILNILCMTWQVSYLGSELTSVRVLVQQDHM